MKSTHAFDWALDTADLLVAAPCPDTDARLRFIAPLVIWAQGARHHLDHRQLTMAEVIAEDCGYHVTLAPEQDADAAPGTTAIWDMLRHKRVALYSLLPQAGARLRERLTALCPEVTVEHNTDTVGSAALRSLAERADYLIVDTWHAAHSVTQAIDSVRPRNEQLFPASGGVMSLLAVLQLQLESQH